MAGAWRRPIDCRRKDATVPEVVLDSVLLRYSDSGSGATVLFVHGVFVDGALWRNVVAGLGEDFRCLCPDLPLGAHVVPAASTADLSPRGVARMLHEFMEALDLRDVTVVANDTGGAITQLLLAEGCDRIARVVLTPCDSFDNFLPRSIRILQYQARVPGALALGWQIMRSARLRRAAFHWLSRRPVPAELAASWARPLLTDRRIRRDTNHFLRAIDNKQTLAAADRLRSFSRPVLLLWPRGAPYFPFAHAERWAEILPDARLVEVPDSFTFVSEDQPEFVAGEIAKFIWASRTV